MAPGLAFAALLMYPRGHDPRAGCLGGLRDLMVGEEEAVRTKARDGTLLPPGRTARERVGEPRPVPTPASSRDL